MSDLNDFENEVDVVEKLKSLESGARSALILEKSREL
jgi:hypothetical protein